MELFVQGLVARIVLGLGLTVFLSKPKFIVPHWIFTISTIVFYLTKIDSSPSVIMLGFVSLDIIVPVIKHLNKSGKPSKTS